MREGTVTAIFSRIVYAGEEFKIIEGTKHELIHVPNPAGGDLKDYVGAYSVVVFKDGSRDFEWMPKWEIEKVRNFSKASKSEYSPWNTWRESMILKSPTRRHCKRLKLSPEVIAATVRDEYRELGYDGEQPPAPRMPRRLSEGSVTVEATSQAEAPQGNGQPAPEPPKEPAAQNGTPGTPNLTAKITDVEVIRAEGKRGYARVTVAGGMKLSTFDEAEFDNLKAMKGRRAVIEYTKTEKDGKPYFNISNWWQAAEQAGNE
jgi:hypothetical protein